ncbi:MAG: ABC transporter substrate-binding protein [Polaromonas sp.]|uniref:ABC transporter substrate-binding protein n=1 Tax=Polaromonas sp. TaxID=1869339 RepID=UPI002488D713|nr:ABC transporter substrate-binding protein [Polaromonas sp.]MDI1238572.1 ABC transporter substrate-binding protein [Polaromonas sp.]
MFPPSPSPKLLLNPARRLTAATAFISVIALSIFCTAPVHAAPDAKAPERVTLQLKWLHQFQFAGYYAALAKGFYRDEGLDVTIREGGAGRPVIATVLKGDAQYGIGDSDLLINRINGQPLVALAAIFQHSPYVIMSRADRRIRSPSDLVGAKVMLSDGQGSTQLRAVLKREGIDPQRVNIVPQSWSLEDLIEGRVDAMSAYSTVEPALLRARGVAPATMRSLDYGVDFYGDILFTTEAQAGNAPERTAAFLRATRKGWEYAFTHEQEIADLITGMKGVRQRGLTRETLLDEAMQMRPLVLPDVVEIGHLNPGRLDSIARTLASLGMVKVDYSLAGLMFEPQTGLHPDLVRWLAGAVFGVGTLLTLALLWNLQMRRSVRERTRQLQTEVLRRTEAQQQLKVSQDMVQLMFGTAASGIVMNTPDGRFLMANPAYYAIVGYSEAELQAMDTRELTHPDDRARYAAQRDRMLAGELESFSDEKRYVKKDGSAVWVHSTVSMVRSLSGEATHIISVTEDITERRAIQDKLRQSEALLRIAGRTARIGGWMLDLPGNHVVWSDEVCNIHEVPPGTRPSLEQALEFYGSPEWRGRIEAVVQACIDTGAPFDEELEITSAGGRRVWVRVIGEVVRDDSGKVIRLHGSTQDITERKQAQESILRLNAELEERVRQRTSQLEALNRELEAFSYSVSHDLRSPLNTIDGFSQLIERMASEKVGAQGKHYLSRIRAGTRQMGELIEGLLSLAKLSRDPLRAGPVDLAKIARQVVQACREREPERVVEIHIQENLLVLGDPLLLSVVIQNLLGNAWKFTSMQPLARIDVGCKTGTDGEAVYFVRDNGAGFDMAYADKLFGTFQRLHSSTDYAGTGIGLATVKRVIERHGGRVWAEAAEGLGATFYFTLGAVVVDSPAVAA